MNIVVDAVFSWMSLSHTTWLMVFCVWSAFVPRLCLALMGAGWRKVLFQHYALYWGWYFNLHRCVFVFWTEKCMFDNVFIFASWRVQGCDAPRLERERQSPALLLVWNENAPSLLPPPQGLIGFLPATASCVVAYWPHTADVWHDIHGMHWTLYQLETSLRSFVDLVYS